MSCQELILFYHGNSPKLWVFPFFVSYWKSLNCQIFGADLSSGPPQTWSEERLQPLPPPWAARRPGQKSPRDTRPGIS